MIHSGGYKDTRPAVTSGEFHDGRHDGAPHPRPNMAVLGGGFWDLVTSGSLCDGVPRPRPNMAVLGGGFCGLKEALVWKEEDGQGGWGPLSWGCLSWAILLPRETGCPLGTVTALCLPSCALASIPLLNPCLASLCHKMVATMFCEGQHSSITPNLLPPRNRLYSAA